MTHSIQEITAETSSLSEPMLQETLTSKHEPFLLSEQTLASDWNRPEEDEAWASYQ